MEPKPTNREAIEFVVPSPVGEIKDNIKHFNVVTAARETAVESHKPLQQWERDRNGGAAVNWLMPMHVPNSARMALGEKVTTYQQAQHKLRELGNPSSCTSPVDSEKMITKNMQSWGEIDWPFSVRVAEEKHKGAERSPAMNALEAIHNGAFIVVNSPEELARTYSQVFHKDHPTNPEDRPTVDVVMQDTETSKYYLARIDDIQVGEDDTIIVHATRENSTDGSDEEMTFPASELKDRHIAVNGFNTPAAYRQRTLAEYAETHHVTPDGVRKVIPYAEWDFQDAKEYLSGNEQYTFPLASPGDTDN